MATLFALQQPQRVQKMVLLAPAIHMLDERAKGKKLAFPVWIYHGRADNVIPLSSIEPVAKSVFSNLHFNVVVDDHFLHQTFKTLDWDILLS
jgi:predicted esterase